MRPNPANRSFELLQRFSFGSGSSQSEQFRISLQKGRKAVSLILDTGATHSLIHRSGKLPTRLPFLSESFTGEQAPNHGESTIDFLTLQGASDQTATECLLNGFWLGNYLLPEAPWLLVDLGILRESLSAVSVPPPDGILGMDWLIRLEATLDFRNSRIWFTPFPLPEELISGHRAESGSGARSSLHR